ncbi:peptidoglycan DD-metalloendopeptidase family protein [Pseudoxanthobacter soli]|nr:peptidoglycan DD-metalloendopeptidase family protein [Pseudoxanthobacter soli]
MGSRFSSRRRSPLMLMAGVALASLSLAGCGDITRFGDAPLFTASTPNQQQIYGAASAERDYAMSPTGGGPAAPVAPVQTAAVTSTALPPPPAAAGSYGMASANPAPLPPPTPAAGAAASYQGWSAANGTPVTAGAGDTAASLSQRYGVPAEAIMAVNGIPDRMTPLTGRRVVIPTFGGSAAPAAQVAAAPAATLTGAGAAGTHQVTSGETLYSVARKYQVTPTALAAANGLTTSTQIKIGEVLRIPAGGSAVPATEVAAIQPQAADPSARPATDATAAGAPPSTLGDAAAKLDGAAPASPAAPAAEGGTQVASLPSAAGSGMAATDGAAAATEPSEEDVGGSGFRWPVRGRIVSGFGKKGSGEQNDGINIAVPEGTPVKAAEAGTVIYAGNELTGFGNLVLIRHEGGWVTAYAHNKDLLVKRGDQVKRGQVIANAGATGSVTQPQVHFELRKGSQPVDPLPHLAGA